YKIETLRQFCREYPRLISVPLDQLEDDKNAERIWKKEVRTYENATKEQLEPFSSAAPALFAGGARGPAFHDLLLAILKKTYDMSPEIEHMSVVQSNHLIEAQYKLSRLAQQTLRTLIAMVQPDHTHFIGQVYRLSVDEFARLLGRTDYTLEEELLEVARELRRTPIVIKTDAETVETSWVQTYWHHHNNGTIDFQFSYLLQRFLLQLQERFTTYKLEDIPPLKHKHSIRIYELLRQYLHLGNREIKLDELKKMLKTDYDYRAIKQRILDPAHREINTLTGIRYDWEAVTGRRKRVVKIRFTDIRSAGQEKEPEESPELTGRIEAILNDPESEVHKTCVAELDNRMKGFLTPGSAAYYAVLRGMIKDRSL
ncbi:MAG: hypothetical protein QG577_2262, partial [Thermodesulfobacteriota bacterium]|nr:hypothetical protein [Thermodesulfobacteriota bacterium]